MTNLNLDDYVPLKEAAKLMGIGYSTIHAYVLRDKLPGAIQWKGTRWYIHKRTIEAFNNGKINVRGAFRKSD
jgi:hypothetical protein